MPYLGTLDLHAYVLKFRIYQLLDFQMNNEQEHQTKRGLEKSNKMKRVIENQQKEGCNTKTSQEVTHPSTTLAQARLTSEF